MSNYLSLKLIARQLIGALDALAYNNHKAHAQINMVKLTLISLLPSLH